MWTGLISVALAAPAASPGHSPGGEDPEVALAVERAKVDILEARPSQAMRHLEPVLDSTDEGDWFALQLYLRACEHAGRMPLCDLEYGDADGWQGFVWRWHHAARQPRVVGHDGVSGSLAAIGTGWTRYRTGELPDVSSIGGLDAHVQGWRLKLRVARKTGDDVALRNHAAGAMRVLPGHPEVLSELFIGRPEGRRARRAQKRALRHVRRQDPGQGPAADALQFRRLRFAMSAGEDALAESIARDLVRRGYPRPATHKPYTDAMHDTLATLIARTTEPHTRGPTAPDRLAVASMLTRRLAELGRTDEALDVWAETRASDDSSSAAAEHAEMLVRAGRADQARPIAEEAIHLAAGPVWDDALRLDASRWKSELGEALAAWARAADAIGEDGGPAARLARDLVPSERMEALVADVTSAAPAGDRSEDAVPAPARALAKALLDDDPVSWSAVRDWLEPRHPELASIADWHSRATDRPADASAPRIRAVRTAFLASSGSEGPGPRGVIAVDAPLPDDVWSALPNDPGTPLVVAAWASWCGPCRKELPALDSLVAELQAEGQSIEAVAVSVDEREAVYAQSVRRFGFEVMGSIRAPGLGQRLAPRALPALWLVDGAGVVRDIRVGYSEDSLSAVRRLVASDER